MEAPSGGSLRNVLRKIEYHIGPVGHEKLIQDKTKQIERVTMSCYLSRHEHKGLDIIKSDLATYREAKGNKVEKAKENLEIHLAGYLFAQNRRQFVAKNGEGSIENYDVDKEVRQIEAVVRALEGQHGQIGTGEGKTSVILPITTIIKSLTTPEQNVLFSSDSTLRVKEFEKFAKPFIEHLKEEGLVDIALKSEGEVGQSRKEVRKTLATKIGKESLFEPTSEKSFSPQLQEELKTEYWQSTFQSMQEQKKKESQKPNTSPTIEIMSHSELMSRYMNDEESFKAQKTPIYMDEAHAPFDRGTTTQLTSESLVISPENVRNATAEWVLHYVISNRITRDNLDYVYGQGTLNKKGRWKMEHIKIDSLEREGYKSHDLFKDAIKKIGATYGADQSDALNNLETTVLTSIKAMFPENSDNLSRDEQFTMYCNSIGEKVAQVYFMDSDAFVITPDGKLIIRDAYQDELLLTHQYNRETDLVTHGLTGLFKVVLPKRASGSKKFSSLLKDTAGRVTCFSGTLIDDEVKTPFAQFLEESTKQKIFDMENPSKKTIPEPVISTDTAQATEEFIKSLSVDSRGMLIIDATTVEHAEETYKKCVDQYGDGLVRRIGSKPTGDIQKELDYQDEVELYSSELAEGKIKALISSGSMGVGMNIVKANGEYPDIKIGVLGIPKSKLQLKQILGRRRAPDSADKKDFYWHVGKDTVMEYVSFYQEESHGMADEYSRAIGVKKLAKDVIAQFEKVQNDPKQVKQFLLDIIKNKELQKMSDLKNETEYDEFYADALEYCEALLTEKIVIEVLGKKNFKDLTKKEIQAIMKGLTPAEKKTISQLVQIIGLPSSLYHDLTRPLQRPLSVDDRSKKQVDLLRRIVMKESFLEGEMEEWNSYYFDQGVDYFNKFVKPLNETAMLDGHYQGIFSILSGISPEAAKYKTVPAEGVITPNGIRAMVRLNQNEEVPQVGKPYALCLAAIGGGDSYEVHPLSAGQQVTFNYGDPIQITRFPVSMANGGTVFLVHQPLIKEQKK